MIRTTIKGFQHLALMLARIAVGVVLVAKGWHRWHTAGIDAQIEILAAAGMPMPDLLGWLVVTTELVGGALLVFGLFTPVVGLAILVLNLGIVGLRKLGTIYIHDGGFEYNLTLAAIGVLFLAFGSGKLGADALFFPPKDIPTLAGSGEHPEPVSPPRPSERTLYSQQAHSEFMATPGE